MSNTTSAPTNTYKNFDFSKFITLSDLQNITTNIIDIISANALKEDKSLSLIEASEIVAQIFRNDKLSDYIVGNIWKNSHLNINQNQNQNENILLDSSPNPNN
jgi:hypothetical protein